MPKKQYIKPDVLQICIFKLRVALDKRNGKDRSVPMASAPPRERPGQQAGTWACAGRPYPALANMFSRRILWVEPQRSGPLGVCWVVCDHPVVGP